MRCPVRALIVLSPYTLWQSSCRPRWWEGGCETAERAAVVERIGSWRYVVATPEQRCLGSNATPCHATVCRCVGAAAWCLTVSHAFSSVMVVGSPNENKIKTLRAEACWICRALVRAPQRQVERLWQVRMAARIRRNSGAVPHTPLTHAVTERVAGSVMRAVLRRREYARWHALRAIRAV